MDQGMLMDREILHCDTRTYMHIRALENVRRWRNQQRVIDQVTAYGGNFWGEQPEQPIHSVPGAMRGEDSPLMSRNGVEA